jgi:hypothetical protein
VRTCVLFVRADYVVCTSCADTEYLGLDGVGLATRGRKTYTDLTGVDGLHVAGRVAGEPHQTAVSAGYGANVGLSVVRCEPVQRFGHRDGDQPRAPRRGTRPSRLPLSGCSARCTSPRSPPPARRGSPPPRRHRRRVHRGIDAGVRGFLPGPGCSPVRTVGSADPDGPTTRSQTRPDLSPPASDAGGSSHSHTLYPPIAPDLRAGNRSPARTNRADSVVLSSVSIVLLGILYG